MSARNMIRWDRHWPVIVFAIVVLLMVSSLSWLWLPDEAPLAWNERWGLESSMYAMTAQDAHRPGFLYLMGMHVAEDVDPENHGMVRLDAWQRYEDGECTYSEWEDGEMCTAPIDAEAMLPLPPEDLSLLCSLREPDCYQDVTYAAQQVVALLDEYQPLLQRYEGLYHYPSIAGSLPFELMSPRPEYAYLMSGHQLKLLSILALQWEMGAEKAIHELLAYIHRQRGHLRDSLDMQDRLMRMGWLEESLSLLVMMHAQTSLTLPPLAPLSNEESHIDELVWRDFASRLRWMRTLGEVTLSYSRPQSLFDMLLMRVFYKPNTTINYVYRKYEQLLDVARLSPSEFTALRERVAPDDELSKLDYLRNSMGSMYASASAPSMRWVATNHNLQAKIELVNAVLQHDVLAQADYPLLSSPFAEEYSWLDDGGARLCVHGARFSCGRDKVCVPYPTTGIPFPGELD